MASKIRILSDQTINQIAAGEVIENPASVVKELVENAIDAGATHVTVETLGGGFQWIKISDDGVGMSPDDAVLSLERHATSKIISADDIFSLTTMGFRGEALASIAAISKMQLVTAQGNAPAISLEVEGGKVAHAGPAARSRGTTLEIRSLFYNVPARKKFQKSAAASSAEVTRIVTQLALAHPEIGITLIQQNRSIFSLPVGHDQSFLSLLKTRAKLLLNDAFLPAAHSLEFKRESYEGKGLIADPLHSRHNRSGQYLFINRRPVFCLPISYAVKDAYGTRLGVDRHPVYVLHLFLPPSLVDVNVHPQKKEVRLKEEGLLKSLLQSAVNEALGGKVESFAESFSMPAVAPFAFSEIDEPRMTGFTQVLQLREEKPQNFPAELSLTHEFNIIGLYRHYSLVEAETFSGNPEEGITVFDLQAVEARLQYDALLKHAEKDPLSQGLLIPLTLSFSKAEAQLLQAHLPTVHKLGLQIHQAGDCVFLVDAIPPFVEEINVKNILEELIAELHGWEKGKGEDKDPLRHLAISISRRARSRKKAYTIGEARSLLQQLLRSSDPSHCPQGRRISFCISEEDIENGFTAKTKKCCSVKD